MPKIQVDEPTIDDHSLISPKTGFRIPLLLWGIFSHLPTCKPTATNMKNSDDIYMLTTDQFNLHDNLYAGNEDNMLYWERKMVEKKHRTKILLSEVEKNEVLDAYVQVSGIEFRTINHDIYTSNYLDETVKPYWWNGPVQKTITVVEIGKLPWFIRIYILPRQVVPRRGWYPCHWPNHRRHWWWIIGSRKWLSTPWWDLWRIPTRQDRLGWASGGCCSF